jgi:dimethylamine corrinoid protein
VAEKQKAILTSLADAVINMDEESAVLFSRKAVASGIAAYQAVREGLAKGMEVVGERYEKGIYFVPELLIAADTMYAGMNVLKPYLRTENLSDASSNYRAVIGVIEGDTHDIGKNLVKIMLEAAGFQIIDLGSDVPIFHFVEAAVKEKADMICLSSLMTTSMLGMSAVMGMLTKEGVRDRFKVLVGGACVSPAFARQIGADGYAPNASAAVAKAKALLNTKNNG